MSGQLPPLAIFAVQMGTFRVQRERERESTGKKRKNKRDGCCCLSVQERRCSSA